MMTLTQKRNNLYFIPFLLILIQLIIQITFYITSQIELFSFFNIFTLLLEVGFAILLLTNKINPILGIGMILITAGHAVSGHLFLPEVTPELILFSQGIFLIINLFAFFVGFSLYEKTHPSKFAIYIGSYLLLFYIFMVRLPNARYLFLLSVLGLCATITRTKLIFFFWAIVFSFTFCQPYAWPTVVILFFILQIIFSIKSREDNFIAKIFLACGLAFLFLVLFPVVVLIMGEDVRSIINILNNNKIQEAITMTMITATLSTSVLCLFCIPLAYAISRFQFFGKSFLLSLIDIPIVIPQSAAGIALLTIFGRNQFLGEIIFTVFGFRFDGTMLGICLAQIFVAMPFIIKSALTAFQGVPVSLEQNARVLGASSLSAFFRVSVPLASKGLFVGAILSWARAAGEFGAVLFIASYPITAPVVVYNKFVSVGLSEVMPIVTTILLFSLVMFFLLQFVSKYFISIDKKEVHLWNRIFT